MTTPAPPPSRGKPLLMGGLGLALGAMVSVPATLLATADWGPLDAHEPGKRLESTDFNLTEQFRVCQAAALKGSPLDPANVHELKSRGHVWVLNAHEVVLSTQWAALNTDNPSNGQFHAECRLKVEDGEWEVIGEPFLNYSP